MTPPFTVVLCEGYHDRSFLAGALSSRLGWTDPREGRPGNKIQDRWGFVGGGDFRFCSPHGADLRLRPCRGHVEVKNQIRAVLHGRETKSFDRLIVNYDGDKGGDGPDYLSRIHQSIGDLLRVQEVAAEACGAGHWRLDDGARELRAVVWHVPTTSAPGVPAQQCLERVICAAVAEVWPDRMASVAEWLAQRPDPTSGLHREGTIPKAYTWTLMGGWFAEHGCDDFFRDIWRSEELAQALERQLGPEVWGHLKACAGPV